MASDVGREYDVIVAGGGFGGLVAGITAAEQGARTVVVEAGSEPGGTTLLAAGVLHIHDPYSWEDFCQAFPSVDPDLGRRLYDDFPKLLSWLRETVRAPMGLVNYTFNPYGPRRPEPVKGHLIGATPRLMAARPVLSSMAAIAYSTFGDRFLTVLDRTILKRTKRHFIRTLVNALTRNGGTLITAAPAKDASRLDDGTIRVEAAGPSGKIELRAPALVIAAGGYQGNVQLLQQYVGPGATRAVCRGSPLNQGDGLRLGQALGAALRGDMDRFYGHPMPAFPQPIDPKRDAIALLTCTVFYAEESVLVNNQGERFADEGQTEAEGNLARAIALLPEGEAWALIDEPTRKQFAVKTLAGGLLPNVDLFKAAARRGATLVQANTLEELAQRLSAHGVNGGRLLQTLKEYNDAVLSGKGADLPVPRSMHARPITTPPFYALKVVPGVTMTYGGLAINTEAQVLDAQGNPLPGVYAIPGAAGGLYSRHYAGALGACGTFGRIAGRNAAAYARQRATTPRPD